MKLFKKKQKLNRIPKNYYGYDMKVKIIAEKVDERVQLKSYSTSAMGDKNTTISGTEFSVDYESYADFLMVDIYFGRIGTMDNLQKQIGLKFKTEWRIDLSKCSGLDCPIIDPRISSDTDENVKTQCFFENFENKEKSKCKLIYLSVNKYYCWLFSILDYCEEDFPVQFFDLKTGCANSDRCQCHLTATYAGSRIFDQTVGKKKTHSLKFKITNQGSEPGYGAGMKFLSPEIDLPFPKGGSPYVLQRDKVEVKILSNMLLTYWLL